MSEQPKPSVGRVVLFKSVLPEHRGLRDVGEVLPAVVTKVWSDSCVNLMVMRDGHEETPIGVTSVTFTPDIDAFVPGEHGMFAWGWMPYQKAVHAGTVEPTKHAT